MSLDWNNEQVAYIMANYGKMPASIIASTMPGERRFTRNAIVGKAKRLGLSSDLIGGGNIGFPRPRTRPKGTPPPPRVRIRKARPPTWLERHTPKPVIPYEEPPMPVLEGETRLHSRSYPDLEDSMCQWPVYVEQGVQMYCAATTERLPGRFDSYCACHKAMSEQPRAERRAKYKQGIWAR